MDGSPLRWALLELMADAQMFGDYDMVAWLLTEAADWMWHNPHDEVIFNAYARLWAAFAQPGKPTTLRPPSADLELPSSVSG